jgi:hypothetical protein
MPLTPAELAKAKKQMREARKAQTIIENQAESIIDISELPTKQAAYALLKENGVSTRDAAKSLGYKENTAFTLNTKLNKYKLSNKKMVVSASNAIKNCLDGTPWGSITTIKDSTALQAASMVMDRFDPKINQNLNVNVTKILPIDLSKYANDNT